MATLSQRFKIGFEFQEQAFSMLWKHKILWLYWLAWLPFFALTFIAQYYKVSALIGGAGDFLINLINVFLICHVYHLLQGKKPTFRFLVNYIKPALIMILVWCLINLIINVSIIMLADYVQTQWPEYNLRADKELSNTLSIGILLLALPWLILNAYTLVSLTLDRVNVVRSIKLSASMLKATWIELGGGWICMRLAALLLSLFFVPVIFISNFLPLIIPTDIARFIINYLSLIFQLAFIILTTLLYNWQTNKPIPQATGY